MRCQYCHISQKCFVMNWLYQSINFNGQTINITCWTMNAQEVALVWFSAHKHEVSFSARYLIVTSALLIIQHWILQSAVLCGENLTDLTQQCHSFPSICWFCFTHTLPVLCTFPEGLREASFGEDRVSSLMWASSFLLPGGLCCLLVSEEVCPVF